MSNNPYKVLGVSPSADDEEIKKAYRELVRKYHPDRYSDSDLADLANEKMKEINAAYEEITRMREAAAGGGNYYEEPKTGYTSAGNTQAGGKERGYGQNMGGGTNYHSQSYSADAKAKFTAIRNYINGGNIHEAERLLEEVEQADRGAEWVFLLGCIQLHKGYYVDAQRSFEKPTVWSQPTMSIGSLKRECIKRRAVLAGATAPRGAMAVVICARR